MHQLEKQTMLSSLMAIRNQLWRASDQNLIHCNAGCTNNHQGSILATARQNTYDKGSQIYKNIKSLFLYASIVDKVIAPTIPADSFLYCK